MATYAMRVSSAMDGGNGDVQSLYDDNNLAMARLAIRDDPFTHGTDKYKAPLTHTSRTSATGFELSLSRLRRGDMRRAMQDNATPGGAAQRRTSQDSAGHWGGVGRGGAGQWTARTEVKSNVLCSKAHKQWFYFKASNVLEKTCRFIITNAGNGELFTAVGVRETQRGATASGAVRQQLRPGSFVWQVHARTRMHGPATGPSEATIKNDGSECRRCMTVTQGNSRSGSMQQTQ